ncbi:MAG TPA: hypothetical protein PK014_05505 [Thermoanaerobaculia bacterium]|nr:hypothetical protein [Thermoanaerobaculia bacterium]HUM28720.1 hypothetical protein [Thermoanaerobaculia bacterium]HXK68031.1 hypothetical protein [Thermoanaerobaculia bacterium]
MKIRCAQCAGSIPLDQPESFIHCPYCDSSLFFEGAKTFLHFVIFPRIDSVAARRSLWNNLKREGVIHPGLKDIQMVMLPFWAVRGKGLQKTVPAFAPCPPELAGVLIPPAGVKLSRNDSADGWTFLEPTEQGEAVRDAYPGATEFSLYYLPFYHVVYGNTLPYEAWIDGVEGRVHTLTLPPKELKKASMAFTFFVTLLFSLALLSSWLIPGPVPALIVIFSLYLVFYLWSRSLYPGGSGR